MSRVAKNHSQMRASTCTGSPKKNAACRSLSNRNGRINPGLVRTCQTTKTQTSTTSCQTRKLFEFGLMVRHISGCARLLRVSLEHFAAKNIPDRAMQLDELREHAHFSNIAWARQVDRESADRV